MNYAFLEVPYPVKTSQEYITLSELQIILYKPALARVPSISNGRGCLWLQLAPVIKISGCVLANASLMS